MNHDPVVFVCGFSATGVQLGNRFGNGNSDISSSLPPLLQDTLCSHLLYYIEYNSILYRGYIRMMEKRMETTVLGFRGLALCTGGFYRTCVISYRGKRGMLQASCQRYLGTPKRDTEFSETPTCGRTQ